MPVKYSIVRGADVDFNAEAAIPAYGVVKPGTDKGTTSRQLLAATAATDMVLGAIQNSEALVTGDGDGVVSNKQPRLCWLPDTPLCKLGGTVNFGDKLTSDGASLAIATTTSGNKFFGVAGKGGVSGDLIPYIPQMGIIP